MEPWSSPPSVLVAMVISSPLMTPSLMNLVGVPPMSAWTKKEILSPTTLPSLSGRSPEGVATVPVNFSPSCLKTKVRSSGLSPICMVPDQLPEISAARAAPTRRTQSTAVAQRVRRVMKAILPLACSVTLVWSHRYEKGRRRQLGPARKDGEAILRRDGDLGAAFLHWHGAALPDAGSGGRDPYGRDRPRQDRPDGDAQPDLEAAQPADRRLPVYRRGAHRAHPGAHAGYLLRPGGADGGVHGAEGPGQPHGHAELP